ncbi:MAG TPA: quinoprotein dehydrogenase-associated putative ABC transporter substrate-binding protein [Bryobacteraceae bacterium]|nr:quinoprotein dehydrogenase-associated putative ABC transporter substrate-binding protein [Bryobacteraceae bacterium]
MFSCTLAAGTLAPAAPISLRVCADPNNLPYSNAQKQGFENEMAAMIGKDIGAHVSYFWYPQRGAFFRKTLGSGACNVVMGVPEGLDETTTTRPYYRSSYVFVSRHDRDLRIHSFDDPRLRRLRVGVHVLGDADRSSPPVEALLSRGLAHNLVGYNIFGNLAEANPPSDLIRAVSNKQVDVAIAWGPLAGYFSRDSATPLDITPIAADPSNPTLPLSFDIAIGVRPGNYQLRDRLNEELSRRAPEIHDLLRAYGIPQMDLSAPAAGGTK